MPWTYKHSKNSKGVIQLALLLFLSILLLNTYCLWEICRNKLAKDKLAHSILKERTSTNLTLQNILTSDPRLSTLDTAFTNFGTEFKTFNNIYSFAVFNNLKLNWLSLKQFKFQEVSCDNLIENSGTWCQTHSLTTSSSLLAENNLKIEYLNLTAKEFSLTFIGTGRISIKTLDIDNSSLVPKNFILLAAYSDIEIENITTHNNTKPNILIYSAQGSINILKPLSKTICDQTGKGALILLARDTKVENKPLSTSIITQKTCLRDFPNDLFTSIKLAIIH